MSEPPTDRERLALETYRKANKLAKWRTVFASWFMGTRLDTDESCRAYKDLVEKVLMLRAEGSALTRLLVESGVVSMEQALKVMGEEYESLDEQLEGVFPGFSTTEQGVHMEMPEASETMKGWPS